MSLLDIMADGGFDRAQGKVVLIFFVSLVLFILMLMSLIRAKKWKGIILMIFSPVSLSFFEDEQFFFGVVITFIFLIYGIIVIVSAKKNLVAIKQETPKIKIEPEIDNNTSTDAE